MRIINWSPIHKVQFYSLLTVLTNILLTQYKQLIQCNWQLKFYLSTHLWALYRLLYLTYQTIMSPFYLDTPRLSIRRRRVVRGRTSQVQVELTSLNSKQAERNVNRQSGTILKMELEFTNKGPMREREVIWQTLWMVTLLGTDLCLNLYISLAKRYRIAFPWTHKRLRNQRRWVKWG